ncbi:hypothetical protein QT381_11930 [Galbitalea sp. SE-J8]|uniref:hypothetical protein n=1 Tax=Galbitalea sp. SE-J8 TaxID=3054952 RepID=UPI00259D0890|nr:hypothetical protein [Galbitalea sp. SE-J8]MDM4763718.1 hypothetical protein [Galbitalea sp. SE-J8]
MTDKGWNVSVGSDAGVSNVDPIPDAEMQSYQDDYNDCLAESGGNEATAPTDLTDAVLKRAWEREQQSWDCLHTAGLTVAEVPSLTSYEQTARSGKFYSTWALLTSNNEESPSDLEHLAKLCPDPMQWFGT